MHGTNACTSTKIHILMLEHATTRDRHGKSSNLSKFIGVSVRVANFVPEVPAGYSISFRGKGIQQAEYKGWYVGWHMFGD